MLIMQVEATLLEMALLLLQIKVVKGQVHLLLQQKAKGILMQLQAVKVEFLAEAEVLDHQDGTEMH